MSYGGMEITGVIIDELADINLDTLVRRAFVDRFVDAVDRDWLGLPEAPGVRARLKHRRHAPKRAAERWRQKRRRVKVLRAYRGCRPC